MPLFFFFFFAFRAFFDAFSADVDISCYLLSLIAPCRCRLILMPPRWCCFSVLFFFFPIYFLPLPCSFSRLLPCLTLSILFAARRHAWCAIILSPLTISFVLSPAAMFIFFRLMIRCRRHSPLIPRHCCWYFFSIFFISFAIYFLRLITFFDAFLPPYAFDFAFPDFRSCSLMIFSFLMIASSPLFWCCFYGFFDLLFAISISMLRFRCRYAISRFFAAMLPVSYARWCRDADAFSLSRFRFSLSLIFRSFCRAAITWFYFVIFIFRWYHDIFVFAFLSLLLFSILWCFFDVFFFFFWCQFIFLLSLLTLCSFDTWCRACLAPMFFILTICCWFSPFYFRLSPCPPDFCPRCRRASIFATLAIDGDTILMSYFWCACLPADYSPYACWWFSNSATRFDNYFHFSMPTCFSPDFRWYLSPPPCAFSCQIFSCCPMAPTPRRRLTRCHFFFSLFRRWLPSMLFHVAWCHAAAFSMIFFTYASRDVTWCSLPFVSPDFSFMPFLRSFFSTPDDVHLPMIRYLRYAQFLLLMPQHMRTQWRRIWRRKSAGYDDSRARMRSAAQCSDDLFFPFIRLSTIFHADIFFHAFMPDDADASSFCHHSSTPFAYFIFFFSPLMRSLYFAVGAMPLAFRAADFFRWRAFRCLPPFFHLLFAAFRVLPISISSPFSLIFSSCLIFAVHFHIFDFLLHFARDFFLPRYFIPCRRFPPFDDDALWWLSSYYLFIVSFVTATPIFCRCSRHFFAMIIRLIIFFFFFSLLIFADAFDDDAMFADADVTRRYFALRLLFATPMPLDVATTLICRFDIWDDISLSDFIRPLRVFHAHDVAILPVIFDACHDAVAMLSMMMFRACELFYFSPLSDAADADAADVDVLMSISCHFLRVIFRCCCHFDRHADVSFAFISLYSTPFADAFALFHIFARCQHAFFFFFCRYSFLVVLIDRRYAMILSAVFIDVFVLFFFFRRWCSFRYFRCFRFLSAHAITLPFDAVFLPFDDFSLYCHYCCLFRWRWYFRYDAADRYFFAADDTFSIEFITPPFFFDFSYVWFCYVFAYFTFPRLLFFRLTPLFSMIRYACPFSMPMLFATDILRFLRVIIFSADVATPAFFFFDDATSFFFFRPLRLFIFDALLFTPPCFLHFSLYCFFWCWFHLSFSPFRRCRWCLLFWSVFAVIFSMPLLWCRLLITIILTMLMPFDAFSPLFRCLYRCWYFRCFRRWYSFLLRLMPCRYYSFDMLFRLSCLRFSIDLRPLFRSFFSSLPPSIFAAFLLSSIFFFTFIFHALTTLCCSLLSSALFDDVDAWYFFFLLMIDFCSICRLMPMMPRCRCWCHTPRVCRCKAFWCWRLPLIWCFIAFITPPRHWCWRLLRRCFFDTIC